MLSMASHYSALYSSSPSHLQQQQQHHHHHFFSVRYCQLKPPPPALLSSSTPPPSSSYNSLLFQAANLLGPPAKFDASKLKVVFLGEDTDTCTRVVPRTYTLSHCDFTANLTLAISTIIHPDQLEGWYNKDDVLAEWTNVRGNFFLDVHCYVSGTNPLQDLAAEFRYHIFSKELPLVLEAVLYGDSEFFSEHQELMDAVVRVFFHSRSKKYNRVECWGPLKNAAEGRQDDHLHNLLSSSREKSRLSKICAAPKSIFQALATLLL